MMIAQCRMARAGLGWTVADLAREAKVAVRTVARFEGGEPVQPDTNEKLRSALVRGGAVMVEQSGKIGVLVGKA